jgi:hypothetical protein
VVLDILFSHPALDFNMRGHNFDNFGGEYDWMCNDGAYPKKTHYTSNLLLEVATDFGDYVACPHDGEPGDCTGGSGYVGFLAENNPESCNTDQPYWGSLGIAEECKNGATPQLGRGSCKWRVVERLKTVEHKNCLYAQQGIDKACNQYCPDSDNCNGDPLRQAFEKCPDVGGGVHPGRGQPVIWRSNGNDKCLDVWSFYNGAKLWIWSCSHQPKQEWFLSFDNKGACQVVSAFVPQYCMTISGGTKKASLMTVSECGTNNWQGQTFDCTKWASTGMLGVQDNTGLCLTVPGGVSKNGTQLFLWDCNPADTNQQWAFVSKSASTYPLIV